MKKWLQKFLNMNFLIFSKSFLDTVGGFFSVLKCCLDIRELFLIVNELQNTFFRKKIDFKKWLTNTFFGFGRFEAPEFLEKVAFSGVTTRFLLQRVKGLRLHPFGRKDFITILKVFTVRIFELALHSILSLF